MRFYVIFALLRMTGPGTKTLERLMLETRAGGRKIYRRYGYHIQYVGGDKSRGAQYIERDGKPVIPRSRGIGPGQLSRLAGE